MKRFIRRPSFNVVRNHFDIIIDIILDSPSGSDSPIAAASYETDLPTGELISPEKDALIGTQALEDYHAFIESIDRLLTRYYELEVYYKNDSDDNSFYYGLLAKNSDGTLLFDFDFTLRISTHSGHNSPESRHNKHQQEAELKKLLPKGKKPTPMFSSIIVNNTTCDSYEEAYFKVNTEVRHKVSIMERKKDWRPKKKAKKKKRK